MKYFLLLFFLFLSFLSLAQTKVSGRVYDTTGETLPFVNVIFKNSHEGTITDDNGRFYLESKTTYQTIIVSYLGFKTNEITLDKNVVYELRIELEEESAQLDEVVIYSGKLSKKDNPAIDILRKIWEHRRENGVKKFDQYSYDKYEKLEFDLN